MDRRGATEGRDAGRDAERSGRHATLDMHLLNALPGTERAVTRANSHDTQKRATRGGGGKPELGGRSERSANDAATADRGSRRRHSRRWLGYQRRRDENRPTPAKNTRTCHASSFDRRRGGGA